MFAGCPPDAAGATVAASVTGAAALSVHVLGMHREPYRDGAQQPLVSYNASLSDSSLAPFCRPLFIERASTVCILRVAVSDIKPS